MKLPTYPAYKPSAIEWLGEVPEHWSPARSDTRVTTTKRQVTPETFSGVDVMHYSIPVVQEFGSGAVENGEDIASAKQVIDEPVVLVSRLNPRKATICRAAPHDTLLTLASSEFVALKPINGDIRFLEYLVSSELFRQRLDSWVQSVTRSHQRARPEEIYRFWNAWPNSDEQRAIADFLDRETAKIDTLVTKKRTLIERMVEKRTALISRTVTRGLPPDAASAAGLDPHPKYKSSGIDWIGDVPKHWEIVPLKWRARCASGEGIRPDEVSSSSEGEAKIPVIGGNGLMGFTDRSNVVDPVLVIGRVGALCGNIHEVRPPAWVTDNALILEADPRTFNAEFLAAVLRSRNLNEIAEKTAQPLITGTQVRDQRLPRPPLEEQGFLARFLVAESTKIDGLISKVEIAIERLTEYRTALITAAVTGKIDVRKVVP